MLQVDGQQFVLRGQPIRLRGVGLGGWLNLEHFMLGLPGTESEIRTAVEAAHGREAAERFWATYYSVYIDEADLRFVRELGLNSIRVPINYRLLGDGAGDLSASTAVRELDRVLAMAKRLELLVVIDLHAVPGGQNPDWHCDNATGDYGFWKHQRHRVAVVKLWRALASRYCGDTTIAGYDLVNEPCYFDARLDSVLVAFYEECIAAIREVDPHHVIFIEGNTYARDFAMFERNLDDQVAYSFHYYPFLQLPDDLRHPHVAAKLRDGLFRDVSMTHLLDRLRRPVWCGETGHPQHHPESVPALGLFLGLLEELGISWSTWPLKDARAMGLLCPQADSAWMRLVGDVTDRWSFWNAFDQDSLRAAREHHDRLVYYRELAQHTSQANLRFRERLGSIHPGDFAAALESFAHPRCEVQTGLVDVIRQITSPG